MSFSCNHVDGLPCVCSNEDLHEVDDEEGMFVFPEKFINSEINLVLCRIKIRSVVYQQNEQVCSLAISPRDIDVEKLDL